jgi:hypothetical protein
MIPTVVSLNKKSLPKSEIKGSIVLDGGARAMPPAYEAWLWILWHFTEKKLPGSTKNVSYQIQGNRINYRNVQTQLGKVGIRLHKRSEADAKIVKNRKPGPENSLKICAENLPGNFADISNSLIAALSRER